MRRRPPKPATLRFSSGLSLIELMVSITIGLIMMIAVISAYTGSSVASKLEEAQSRMNEDGQAALAILTQHLRMAGMNPKQPNYDPNTPRNPVYTASTYSLRGCDGSFSNQTTAANIESLVCPANGSTAPDSIAISYEADQYTTAKTTTGLATDCLGQTLPTLTATQNVWNGTASVPTNISFTVADNRFYIGTSSVIQSPSLYCKGNGGINPQPLVENIEDLQLIYGTTASTGTSLAVAGYLSATGLLADSGLAALADDPTRWTKVITVRVCVLVRSENQVVADAASAQYIQCDGTQNTNPPDLRLRRAYTTTVVLRSRLAS
jgi:type IV pilus assembly protein PilW